MCVLEFQHCHGLELVNMGKGQQGFMHEGLLYGSMHASCMVQSL